MREIKYDWQISLEQAPLQINYVYTDIIILENRNTYLSKYNRSETEMKKYLKFIKRQKMPQLELEDKKMPMTEVIKNSNSLKFIHNGDGNEVSAARTAEPLPSSSAVVYFQAYVRSLNVRYEAGVGIIQKDCALKRHPGQSNMSIGYLSTGEILINGKKTKKVSSFKPKSIVGMGIIYSKQKVFFTLDGNLLETLSFQHNPATWPKFYPCLSLRSHGDHIQLRFKDFAYNFEQLRSRIQHQSIEEIEKEPINTSHLYSLVGDYLKFHGYKETYNKLKQSQSFPVVTSFIQHPFWQCKLNFSSTEELDQQYTANIQQKANKKKMSMDEDIDQIVINRKSSTRQRIMSDYWGDILPNQLPRKRIYQHERSLLESRRKSSLISNTENEDNDKKNKRDFQQAEIPQEPKTLNDRDKFLVETRIQVLRLIRVQKIQEAHELLQKSIPQLFEVLEYLEAYFYMHIYIRILKNDGAAKAMLYMRTQAEKFKKFKQQLYPVFDREGNKLKFVTFSQMMGLVSLKPGTSSSILSSQQFYIFSNYVNELILKNMGLYQESRLDTLVNHIKCIGTKSQQYQINGLSILYDI